MSPYFFKSREGQLFAARLIGITPVEMFLIGIQPKSMESGIELSEEIKMKMEPLVEKVLQKLKEWGVEGCPKRVSTRT